MACQQDPGIAAHQRSRNRLFSRRWRPWAAPSSVDQRGLCRGSWRRQPHLPSTKPRDGDVSQSLKSQISDANNHSAFDGVVNSYHELAGIILQSLHLEVRCHTMYHVSQCFTTTYRLDQLFNDPDPDILRLNSSLSAVEEEVASQLQPVQHHFITHGIALLADTMLVANAAKISRMNANGCGRMSLNILVLQQNLKNIEADAVLTRATMYYNLFGAGPDAVVQLAKESKDGGEKCVFTYEELKVLLELYYSEENASERREVAMKAKTALNDALLQLSEYLWQEGGSEGGA